MENFILCKANDGSILEVDVEDDGTVGLETLKSVFGDKAAGLIYTNTSTGRDRLVRVSDKNLLEPKDGWKTPERVYCVTFRQGDTPVATKEQVVLQDKEGSVKVNAQLTPQIGPLPGVGSRSSPYQGGDAQG